MIRKKKSDIIKRREKKSRNFLTHLLILFGKLVLILVSIGIVSCIGLYLYIAGKLPQITSLRDYNPPIITTVYSDDNRKVGEFYNERRVVVPLSQMPEKLIQAFIAAEDARFYQHKGIDFTGIIRALFKNIKAGEIVQGGSTITQQVTKSFLLTPERSYRRKIKEALLAYNIDKKFKKEDILFLYLNQIYLGHGAYGVEAAANNYFGKSVQDLNLAECALLAGLPTAPSRFSPVKNPKKAEIRRIYVLNRMISEGYITNAEATVAIDMPINMKPRRNLYLEQAPYYTEHVRRYIEKKYGKDTLYNEGLKIYTTVNIEMQKIANEAVKKGLLSLDKRQGYRGPLKKLFIEDIEYYAKKHEEETIEKPLVEGDVREGIVVEIDTVKNVAAVRIGNIIGILSIENMKWARKPDIEVAYYETEVRNISDVLEVGDLILVKIKSLHENDSDGNETKQPEFGLEQVPDAQSALLCIESETGYVKAMIGGMDFAQSQFNRAVQAKRQPGSAFKPIIYAAALDKGYTPATVLIDSPIVFEDEGNGFIWKPRNYKEKFYGPTLFRQALAKSRNVVTIKILKDIGIDYVIDYAKKMGIKSDMNRDLSFALGSSSITLLEMVSAYALFANRGYLVEPVFITKIIDRNGNVLEENTFVKKKVIEESTAYIMTNLLESVVKEGTGYRAKVLKRPVAGKTGTTNNLCDAWFIGYTPRYITGVWTGFDDIQPLGKGETGSRVAAPIWLDFMQQILADKPVRAFQSPEGVVFSKIDAETGLLPTEDSKEVIIECFKEGTVPSEYTPKKNESTDVDLFKYE